MKHLIRYSDENNIVTLFVCSLTCREFIKLYLGIFDKITITQFYGSDTTSDYDLSDSKGITSLISLLEYFDHPDREDLVLNNLEFKTHDGSEVYFNDDFECTVSCKSTDSFCQFWEPMSTYLNTNISFLDELKEMIGKYVVIGNDGTIKARFNDFDEYINSNQVID